MLRSKVDFSFFCGSMIGGMQVAAGLYVLKNFDAFSALLVSWLIYIAGKLLFDKLSERV